MRRLLFVLLTLVIQGVEVSCVMCFSCETAKEPGCENPFYLTTFMAHQCYSGICALQKQYAVPGVQTAATGRGCYLRGKVPGLDSSEGCRNWTIEETGYTALYCFCSTDFCNGASGERVPGWRVIGGALFSVILLLTRVV